MSIPLIKPISLIGGLVGDATVNGWGGPDMKMYETDTDVYELYANLTVGFIKFRFNGDWGKITVVQMVAL